MSDETPEQLFYIRDARNVVGNCATWWAKKSCGYTTQLGEAEKYTRQQAFEGRRETDIPVPCELAERIAVQHVRVETLRGALETWSLEHPVRP